MLAIEAGRGKILPLAIQDMRPIYSTLDVVIHYI
jgi:hypothetical protein